MIPKTIDEIVKALDENNIDYVIDSSSRSLNDAMALATNNSDSKTTLLISADAIKKYDSIHPERIAAIVLTHTDTKLTYRVIVNDRESSCEKFWLPMVLDNEDLKECPICYKPLGDKLVMCTTCKNVVCFKCFGKIESKTHDGGFRCVKCREWNLNGHGYGLPFERLFMGYSAGDSGDSAGDSRDSAGNSRDFFKMFQKLDGEIIVIPRIGDQLIVSMSVILVKLSGTDRYVKGSLKKAMKAFNKFKLDSMKNGKDVRFYVVRQTYSIDRETTMNPVREASAFRINLAGEIEQLLSHAWTIKPLEDMGIDDVSYRKVELMRPTLYEKAMNVLESFVRQIEQAMKDACGSGTKDNDEVSVEIYFKEKVAMSFDFNRKTLDINTANVELLSSRIAYFIESRDALLVKASLLENSKKLSFTADVRDDYATLNK